MLHEPPRGRERLSWFVVALWVVVIFVSIPFARRVQESVTARWGREMFAGVVVAVVYAVACFVLVRGLRSARKLSRSGMAWLCGVTALILFGAGRFSAPEESLHFIEYGVLGLLLFRALSHRLHDPGVYIVATLAGIIVGAFDEMVQWITPERFFDFRDIRLNGFAVLLMITALAKGIRPAYISGRVTPTSVRWSCGLAAALLVILGLFASNTPVRIARYTEPFPAIQFLRYTTSQMVEYGYLHEDPEIGSFYSRFLVPQLRRIDRERAVRAARVLDAYRDPRTYGTFLGLYTPGTDPFLHEARVHLYRRDYYTNKAYQNTNNPVELRDAATIAYGENALIEKYFGKTLRQTSCTLPPRTLSFLERNADRTTAYRSEVSAGLITRVTNREIGIGIILALIVLGVVSRYYGRETGRVP